MAEKILVFILSIPLYAVLIWTYLEPRESLLWGKRWMYKEEPELSEGAIRYTKVASAISVVFLTILLTMLLFV